MIRTVISIEPDEKIWLEHQAKSNNVTMAEMIRRAIRNYHEYLLKQGQVDIITLLQDTHGMGFEEEGLQYQERIRSQWDERT